MALAPRTIVKPSPPEIPEFRDVERRPAGSWRPVHKPSGDVISADTFERLKLIEAPMVARRRPGRGVTLTGGAR